MPPSAVDRAARGLAAIDAFDQLLRSCILIRSEAVGEAASIDRRKPRGPLAGWTVAVKDNTDVAGTVRTDGLGPPFPVLAMEDAAAVKRLRAGGAVVLAKTNLEELSFGATTQNPTWGSCRNPWDLNRIPGGSSGGSAAAVAAGLVDVALGTDTGGSLRNPASFCGLSALRPTHGLVPTAGVTPLSPSMDVVGPIAHTARELRLVMTVLAALPAWRSLDTLSGLRIGVPGAYFADELDSEVSSAIDEWLSLLRTMGARLFPIRLGNMDDVPDAMAILQNAEAATSLRAYWDDSRVSAGIQERISVGRSATARQLELASLIADRWRDDVSQAFADVDVMVTAATPFVAPAIGGENLVKLSRRINRLTGCWSLLGAPALGIPLSPTVEGLPVGGQVIAPRGRDDLLLAVGELIQEASDWHSRLPPLVASHPTVSIPSELRR